MNYNNKKIYYNKLFPKLKDNKYNKLQIDYNLYHILQHLFMLNKF